KQRQDLLRRHGGNCSTHSRNCGDNRVVEILSHLTQIFGIKLDSEPHRADEVASERGELPSLGFGWLACGWSWVSTLRPNHKLVSAARNSDQQPRSLRIRFDLAPEPSNKHVNAAIEGFRTTTADGTAQLFAR